MLAAMNPNFGKSEESTYIFFQNIEKYLMSEESCNKTIDRIEEELFQDIMELGRRLLQKHSDIRGDGDVGKAVIRKDGQILSHKRLGEKQSETLFGRIIINRIGYGYPGETGIFPKDEQTGFPEKIYSYPVQQRVCREAVRGSFDDIDETLSEYTGAHVPKRQCPETVNNSAKHVDAFYDQKSGKASDSEIIVTSADGKGIIMRPEGLREKTRKRAASQKVSERLSKGEKRNRKRESLVATVYNIAPQVRSIEDVTEKSDRKEKSAKEAEVRPEEKRVRASIEKDKDEVFQDISEEGLKREPSDKTAVFISDGAESVQKRAKEILKPGFEGRCRSFLIISDLIHVIEYLWKAAYVFFQEGSPEAEMWVKKYLRMIPEGKSDNAVREMKQSSEQLNESESKAVGRAAGYLTNNKEYMCYDEYLKAGLPIATGVIEGACRHSVKDRFEISGAGWGSEGAESLLKLRAVYQSGDWNEYRRFNIDQEQKRMYPEGHWNCACNSKRRPNLTLIKGGKISK